MIVCPNCRHANEEGLETCSNCGRTLEPGPSLMLATRRTQEEISQPKPPARWPGFTIVGVLVLGLIGFFVWKSVRPDPCRGTNFTSDRFGYCLTVPQGWTAGTAQVGTLSLDQFSLPKGSTTVLVEVADISDNTDLNAFAQVVRKRDQDAGLVPGPIENLRVDGVTAEQWDISLQNAAGETFQLREVVVVRKGFGWRITLNDSEQGFDQHVKPFQHMLESWRFA